MTQGLVLGGGGIVGMGYHAGVLKALSEWGLDVTDADVVVGTSAGAIIGAYLRSGWKPEDFYDYAHGRHPDADADPVGEMERLFQPLARSRIERFRRGIGSAFAMASSRGLLRGFTPPPRLRRLFPSGIYSTTETHLRLIQDIGETWPAQQTFLCAADLYTGKRVAFGTTGAPESSFADAVLASTAIPGLFPPVRIGGRYFVDGGIVSATSLDLAVEAGCNAILCVAPLGYMREEGGRRLDPKAWGPMLIRSPFARTLRKEVNAARAAGVEVLVIRPWSTDLRTFGTNSMGVHDRRVVVSSAREGTLRLLERMADHPALQDKAAR